MKEQKTDALYLRLTPTEKKILNQIATVKGERVATVVCGLIRREANNLGLSSHN